MSRLAHAATALFRSVSSFNGETVTVQRGTSTCTVTACASKPELAFDDQIEARIQAEALDWTLLAADYLGAVAPVEGDWIVRSDGSTYELMNPPYRLSDSAGIRLRLHSKRVK